MQTKATAKLSILGVLDIIPALASIVTVAVFSALTGFFRSHRDPPSLHLHIAYAILRKATVRLTPVQLQLISPLTNVVYKRYARSTKIKAETVDLGHGAQGHWLGNKDAKNVLIWYHGGGFCLPANLGYFKFLDSLIASSRKANKDLAVFVLTYTLAPGAAYPTQLIQAVHALRYILKQTGRKPSQVLIGGDSAGGNLVMGVLSHLAHVHPSIPELKISEPLAGAVGIAPWTLIGEDHSDREIYSGGDLITPAVDRPWSSAFLGGAEKDYFTSASIAPQSWFEKYPVKNVLICGGGSEILLPAIEDLAEKLKAALPNVELFVGPGEGHVAPVYNIYVGDTTETQQGKKVKSWLREIL
ncbi:hypothetical protein QQS21_001425 [Conoideocrella luteorostrata]|uniref:Alpha/beta hydrolase fold-3 domain-containing protein n=1 Tax=Conoideocrella luteorostrata TaxID=1105319 RepID=A0AAJ0D0K1_9HYPO|nr:hypothetical protein QQS21_001425 [Conoideocrella luteorostrata]